MKDPKKGWRVQVDSGLPGDAKLRRLAALIKPEVSKLVNPEELISLGVLLKLWCFTMRSHDTGKLDGLAADDLALECGWVGPEAASLVSALMTCGQNAKKKDGRGFLTENDHGYEVHEWALWQNDPAGKREYWRAYRENKRSGDKAPGRRGESPAPKEGDEVMRQILQEMRTQKITGALHQKREQIEAWRAQGMSGGDIHALIKNNPGKDIFWLRSFAEKKPSPAPSNELSPGAKKAVADIAAFFSGKQKSGE
jgi:hypothetical protein